MSINLSPTNEKRVAALITALDLAILSGSGIYLILWFTDLNFLYTENAPVLSPLTCFSLLLMTGGRLAHKHLTAWPTLLTMAWLGIVIGGNLSSIMVQMMMPTLITDTYHRLVPTSIMTSFGLIAFCTYELLIIIRKTPRQAFILDDILLHLALVPGGLSLLGHTIDNPYYISSSADPRIGISLLEMAFMGAYAVVAALANRDLFLWHFLRTSAANRLIFVILVTNQYLAPVFVAWLAPGSAQTGPGVELFVMLGGVLATLMFLIISALNWKPVMKPGSS